MEFAQTRVILGHFGNKVESHSNSASSSCVPKDCQNFIVDHKCTCAEKIMNTTCHETSDQAVPTVLWSISAVILFLFVFELFLIRYVSI